MAQNIFFAYIFKFLAALLDTPLAYLGRYLINKHIMDDSEVAAEVASGQSGMQIEGT